MDKDFVLVALLQHNFLPIQKKDREELPPVFTSATFTPDVARKLVAGKPRQTEGYPGYDAVDYRLTRFNGVSRSSSIPHPTAYSQLALCIHEHWNKLDYISTNKNSLIRPRQHRDGRLIVMDYERSLEKTKRSLKNAFGRRFVAHTDISNCFPSIYSHAIPWATVGFAHAKSHRPPRYEAEWFNQLDKKLRWLKRNETQGVAIGPATSNIVSEAILARIDGVLKTEFVFVRYIDDYTAYCQTEEEAQVFFRRLAEELSKYKLLLNINKTQVTPLPQALTGDYWIAELSLLLPKGDEINGHDAVNYLNLAVDLAKKVPGGSVMKYALKSLLRRKLKSKAVFDVTRYALALSFYQPALLPLLEDLFRAARSSGAFSYGNELQRLAMENARLRHSDGMAWVLYYLNKYEVDIDRKVADEILVSRDCVALMLLYLSGKSAYQENVVHFVRKLDPADLYELDQYWLLLYELYRDGKIPSLYTAENAFEIMKDKAVSFLESLGVAATQPSDKQAQFSEGQVPASVT